jgi:F-type H+-transporting ATPase subunit c
MFKTGMMIGLTVFLMLIIAVPMVFAAAEGEKGLLPEGKIGYFIVTAIVTSLGLSIAAVGGAVSQSRGIRSALEGIARNPGASGTITTAMIIGLALIESLVIYVLVVSLILLFADPFGLLS